MAASGNKWSKKDLKTLIQQLSSWWLFNSMYLKPGVAREHVWDTMPLAVRTNVVVNGLREFQRMVAERAQENRETAEHYRGCWADNGTPRDPSGETVERFARMAVEDDKAATSCQKLIDRVEAEGLPPEVAAWRPDK